MPRSATICDCRRACSHRPCGTSRSLSSGHMPWPSRVRGGWPYRQRWQSVWRRGRGPWWRHSRLRTRTNNTQICQSKSGAETKGHRLCTPTDSQRCGGMVLVGRIFVALRTTYDQSRHRKTNSREGVLLGGVVAASTCLLGLVGGRGVHAVHAGRVWPAGTASELVRTDRSIPLSQQSKQHQPTTAVVPGTVRVRSRSTLSVMSVKGTRGPQ